MLFLLIYGKIDIVLRINQLKEVETVARKSNEMLLKEKLAKISPCPFDIFELLTPTDELFDLIKRAENMDVDAISELTESLGKIAVSERRHSDALVYFSKSGVEKEIISVALTVISYSLALGECFSLALDALEIVNEKAPVEVAQSVCGVKDELRAMKLVDDISNGCSADALDADAALLPAEIFSAEHIYLFSYKLRCGSTDCTNERELLIRAGIPQIMDLPSFCGQSKANIDIKIEDTEEFLSTLLAIESRHDDSEWRDFWTRIIYESAERYFKGSYTSVASHLAHRALARKSVRNRNAQALAWIHYLLFSDSAVFSESERERLKNEYEHLSKSCMFEGIMPDTTDGEELSSLMREAVYTSEKEMQGVNEYMNSLGSIIRHENNRFLMECELSGHSKRGHKHTWEFKMSIPKEFIGKKMPAFQSFKVEKANPYVTRGGITLEKEKASSQIICRSEIKFGEAAHPFLIDIILDVNYISSVKCTLGELRIKKMDEGERYITYTCQLLLS